MSPRAAPHFLATAARSGAILRAAASARIEALGVRSGKGVVDKPAVGQVNQKAGEQNTVHAGLNRQREIGTLGCCRATDIDGDHAGAALLPRAHHPLKEHRMAPRRIRSNEHHEVRLVEVFVAAWHRIRPKARLCPATEEAMQRREFVSTLAAPIKPFISLLAT